MFPVLLPTPRVRGAAERDLLVARLRAFGFRVSTAIFFHFSEFPFFTESTPIDPHGIYSSNGPNTHAISHQSTRKCAARSHPSTNSSRRTPSTCASHRRGTFTDPTVPPMSWLAARAAREACSTSGRRSLLRGAIASCIARGADAGAVAPHPSSRWETAFPSALWRQDRGAKRANRRVDVVLLQVRPRPRSHSIVRRRRRRRVIPIRTRERTRASAGRERERDERK